MKNGQNGPFSFARMAPFPLPCQGDFLARVERKTRIGPVQRHLGLVIPDEFLGVHHQRPAMTRCDVMISWTEAATSEREQYDKEST